MPDQDSIIRETIKYINKEYYSGSVFCQGQGIHKLVDEVNAIIASQSGESIAEDVAPAESEPEHYTSGGVDDDRDTEGFAGFANGAE